MDRYTEVTNTSYLQNIGNSLKGIFVGFIILIISIAVLWWNEGRSVDQATALQEMKERIITLPDTIYDVKYANKPVLVQGTVTPLKELVDSEFGVVSNDLILDKTAEMYQWKEQKATSSEDKLGGGTETVTTYSYVKGWSTHRVNSSSFKKPEGHENPEMKHKGKIYTSDAQMGDFYLDKSMVKKISAAEDFTGLESMPETIGDATNYQSFLYIGEDPEEPEIGDVKISYKVAESSTYTFAAKEQNKALVPYVTSNGKSFVFVRDGNVSALTIFNEEFESNKLLTWGLRAGGLIAMFFAFMLIMGPLSTLANVIPMLGSFVGGATAVIAITFTLILGSIIIALAWFSARPLIALAVIVVGIGGAVALAKLAKRA